MLVEGGYLHSMRRLIEIAEETPDAPGSKRAPGSRLARWARRKPSAVRRPLKRLAVILLGLSDRG